MLYVLSRLAWPLLNPANQIALLLVTGVILLWTRWLRLGRILISMAVVILTFGGILPSGTWLLVFLERQFPLVDPPAHVDGVIALSGAALMEPQGRLKALAELHRRYPQA